MSNTLSTAGKVPRLPDGTVDFSGIDAKLAEIKATLEEPFKNKVASPAVAPASSIPGRPAQRRQVSSTLLRLEALPVSAYVDNPLFDEISAAVFLRVTAACLKKWRQRKQGPDYIQYGTNGPVRYELNALMEFRDRHKVRLGN